MILNLLKSILGLRKPIDVSSYQRDDWRRAIRRFRNNSLSKIGLGITIIFIAIALGADVISPYPDDAKGALDFTIRFQPPSAAHPFGTDEAGRDVFSRVIFGTRIDLSVAIMTQLIITGIAIFLGLIAAFSGFKIESVILRSADIFMSMPPLILALAATTAFEKNLTTAMLAVIIAFWPWQTRLIHSAAISVKQELFIEAAVTIGKGRIRTVFEDILPHILSVVTVKATLDLGRVIIFVAALNFLGLGAQSPTPSWGTMISDGRNYLPEFWWLSTFPGIFIFFAVLGFALLGDGLRDVFDVQLEESKF